MPIALTYDEVKALGPFEHKGALCACGCGNPAPIASRTNKKKGAVRGQAQKFISGHNRRGTTRLDRFEVTASGCWEWTGPVNRKGYGYCQVGGVRKGAHRAVYEASNGPVPRCLHVDHICRNKRCVNPAHLEPVTPLENERRKRDALSRGTSEDWPLPERAKAEAA